MSYDPDRHHRRSIRLQGYDYAQVGAYYVTLCTHHRNRLFGRVVDGAMELSEAGQIAERALLQTPDVRPNTWVDAYLVMPDHVHMIFVIAYRDSDAAQGAAAFRSPAGTLGAIVRGYKGAVTSQVNKLRGTEGPIWQRNYYEHVVRNDADLNRIRRYIAANPARWSHTTTNPHEGWR
jgi:putative transposase